MLIKVKDKRVLVGKSHTLSDLPILKPIIITFLW
jgi:hypothetical protein